MLAGLILNYQIMWHRLHSLSQRFPSLSSAANAFSRDCRIQSKTGFCKKPGAACRGTAEWVQFGGRRKASDSIYRFPTNYVWRRIGFLQRSAPKHQQATYSLPTPPQQRETCSN